MRLFNYYPNNPKKLDPKMEKRIFIHSLILPALFVFVFWMVKITELVTGIRLVEWGVFPLEIRGLPGILFSPFIHSGFSHLLSNSIPFFILFFALIYFYRHISYRIFIQLYLLAGLTVWLAGRPAWHIGASGVVYALAAFHFVSGIIRNDVRLLTLSVVVVFLYGGMVWGLLPIDPKISWEGHLWGAVSGVVLAFYYRKYIIRRDKFEWEEENDDDDDEDDSAPPQTLLKENTEEEIEKKQGSSFFPSQYGENNTSHTGEF